MEYATYSNRENEKKEGFGGVEREGKIVDLKAVREWI